jgi:hypothetical protein
VQLSYSSLDLLTNCPFKWKLHYIDRSPEIMHPSALLGTAVHLALKDNFIYKKETKIDLTLDVLLSRYAEYFDDYADSPGEWKGNEGYAPRVDWSSEDRGRLKDQGILALSKYYQNQALFLAPAYIEESRKITLNKDFTLMAKIDLITETGIVIDYKTVPYKWNTDRVETSLQPLITAAVLQKAIEFEFHFLHKQGDKVGSSIARTGRSEQDIAWLHEVFLPPIEQLLQVGIFPPCPGTHCYYCSYQRDLCKYRYV